MMSMTMPTRSGTSSMRRRRSSARTRARGAVRRAHRARVVIGPKRVVIVVMATDEDEARCRTGRDAIRFDSTLHPYVTRARRRRRSTTVVLSLYSIVTLIIVTGVLGAVAGVDGRAFDGLDDVHALDHASEHRVLTRR